MDIVLCGNRHIMYWETHGLVTFCSTAGVFYRKQKLRSFSLTNNQHQLLSSPYLKLIAVMLKVSPVAVRVTGRLVITVVVGKTLCYWLSTAARDAVHQSAGRTLPCWAARAETALPYHYAILIFIFSFYALQSSLPLICMNIVISRTSTAVITPKLVFIRLGFILSLLWMWLQFMLFNPSYIV